MKNVNQLIILLKETYLEFIIKKKDVENFNSITKENCLTFRNIT